jgi:hypothetical protein
MGRADADGAAPTANVWRDGARTNGDGAKRAAESTDRVLARTNGGGRGAPHLPYILMP